jgi:hypothetical protein
MLRKRLTTSLWVLPVISTPLTSKSRSPERSRPSSIVAPANGYHNILKKSNWLSFQKRDSKQKERLENNLGKKYSRVSDTVATKWPTSLSRVPRD